MDLPLASGGVSVGFSSLGERDGGREYGPKERDVLQQAVDHVHQAVPSVVRGE